MVALKKAVKLHEISKDIIQIIMCDEESKNTFSLSLVEGLIEAFKFIKEKNQYKAVILTGYSNYFATGGTKETLLDLQAGKGKFTDKNYYDLALECPVPVISAMQGHAIGGGFVMGLFADFIILSRESIYSTNFMKYGFTPGVGATLIVPEKLGIVLGHEMLLGAKTYYGAELKERGIPCPVYSRNEVLPKAIELAEEIANKPKISLEILKRHLVEPISKKLDDIVSKELSMHEKTFHSEEVRDNISKLF